jgi:quinol monooxygenase YgiN
MNVREGKEEEFEAAMSDLVAKVDANEPGCHLYKICRDADGGYSVLEIYEDEDAAAAHVASEHFKATGASFKGLMGGPPEVIRMDVVG